MFNLNQDIPLLIINELHIRQNNSRDFLDLHSIIYSCIFAIKDYKSLRDNGFTLIHAEQKSCILMNIKRRKTNNRHCTEYII